MKCVAGTCPVKGCDKDGECYLWRAANPHAPFPCAEKRRYNSYEQAVAMAVIRTQSDHDTPEALKVYRCPHCRKYHLTKNVESERQWPAIRA